MINGHAHEWVKERRTSRQMGIQVGWKEGMSEWWSEQEGSPWALSARSSLEPALYTCILESNLGFPLL